MKKIALIIYGKLHNEIYPCIYTFIKYIINKYNTTNFLVTTHNCSYHHCYEDMSDISRLYKLDTCLIYCPMEIKKFLSSYLTYIDCRKNIVNFAEYWVQISEGFTFPAFYIKSIIPYIKNKFDFYIFIRPDLLISKFNINFYKLNPNFIYSEKDHYSIIGGMLKSNSSDIVSPQILICGNQCIDQFNYLDKFLDYENLLNNLPLKCYNVHHLLYYMFDFHKKNNLIKLDRYQLHTNIFTRECVVRGDLPKIESSTIGKINENMY